MNEKTMMMKTTKFLLLSVLILSSCEQNPLSSIGGTVTQEKQQEPLPPHPAYVISAPRFTNCDEMKLCKVEIRAQVPSPGLPILKIGTYPAGSSEKDFVYDEKRGVYTFSWTPSYDLVAPIHGKSTEKDIALNLRLWSSLSEETIITDEIMLKVSNTPQEWSVRANGDREVDEGDRLSQVITVNNPDFPQGPFKLFVDNAPAGTEIIADESNPNRFVVTFTPGYTFVKANEAEKGYYGYYKDIEMKFRVKEPGEDSERFASTTWTINDVRREPVFSGPKSLGAREQAAFSIRADDLNGEVPPTIKLKNEAPFGRVEYDENPVQGVGGDYPSMFWNVRWVDIPAEKQGQAAELTFQACSEYDDESEYCADYVVNVDFLAKVAPPPVIKRGQEWKEGEVKYVKVGEVLRTDVEIEDPEEKSRVVHVDIFPESMRDQVSWEDSQLVVAPTAEGLVSFSVEATTVPGQKRSEHFLVHVLPRNWSDVMIFSSDKEKPETEALLDAFPSADFVHPFIQKSDPVPFVRRKALVITTELLSAMTTKSDWAWLDAKMQEIPNLWVTTPLIGKLASNSPYFAKLLSDREVKLPGRMSTFFPATPIGDFYLENGTYSLPASKKSVHLHGKMTPESADPSLVEIGDKNEKCQNVFRMRSTRAIAEMAAICDRDDGGKLVLFGAEMVDFAFESEDAGLLKLWIEQMLSAGGAKR